MPTARAGSPSRRNPSGRRAAQRRPREPLAASTRLRLRALDGLAVALQPVDLRLGLRQDPARQRRVLQLRSDLLAVARRVLQPRLDLLGLRLADAGLAEVLVDEQEG